MFPLFYGMSNFVGDLIPNPPWGRTIVVLFNQQSQNIIEVRMNTNSTPAHLKVLIHIPVLVHTSLTADT